MELWKEIAYIYIPLYIHASVAIYYHQLGSHVHYEIKALFSAFSDFEITQAM